jgi:tetratricopeptide (TPR) repeat protein
MTTATPTAKDLPSDEHLHACRSLRADRQYDRARKALTAALGALAEAEDEASRGLAQRYYVLLGNVEDDYGHHLEAADAYERAATCLRSAGGANWMRALSSERRYRSADRLQPGPARELRAKLRQDVDLELDRHAGNPAELVPLLWLRARLLSGAHLDDRPTREELQRALVDVEQALRFNPDSGRLLVTKARVVRVATSYGDDVAAKVDEARKEIDRLPDGTVLEVGSHDLPRTAIDYERAQLEMVGRDLEGAVAMFDAVIANTKPTHQAAQVWRLYCRRVMGVAPETELLAEIEALLTASSNGRPPPIINEDLRAELLTERAALLESASSVRALEDYEKALRQRPRMPFAVRGTLRCRYMNKQEDEAFRLAGELLHREASGEREDELTADVLTEIAQLYLSEHDYEESLALLDRAIAVRPTYSYAYAQKVRALRLKGQTKDAVRFARHTLSEKHGKLSTVGGIRIELGHALLARSRPNSALQQFEQAESDASSYISARARAGRLQALLWKRDLHAAGLLLSESVPAISSGTAAGLYYGAIGDYDIALQCFRSGRGLPEEIGKARIVRLLGRPLAARRDLQKSASDYPRGMRLDLLTEMGWAAVESGDYEDALSLFDDVLSKDPASQLAHRGRIAATKSSTAKIGEYTAAALAAAGDDPRARGAVLTEAGTAYLASGDRVKARALFAEANEYSTGTSQRLIQGRALWAARALAEAEAVVADAAHLAAVAVVSRVDTAEVLREVKALIEEAQKSDPRSLSQHLEFELAELSANPDSRLVAERVRVLWRELVGGLDFRSASEAVEQLIDEVLVAQDREARNRRPPPDPDVLLLMGHCRLSRRAGSSAMSHFAQVEQICGSRAVVPALARSLASLEENDPASALRRLMPLVRAHDSSVRAKELLAWAKLSLMQRELPRSGWINPDEQARMSGPVRYAEPPVTAATEIIELCQSVISDEPGRGEAYACLAALAVHEERIPDAIAYLEEAVTAVRGDAYPLREKAALLFRIGNYEEARACVTAALERDPFDPRARVTEGLIALEQEQTTDAISSLRQAHALDPSDPFAPVALGTALEAAGRHSEANDVLTRALQTTSAAGRMQVLLARARLHHSMANAGDVEDMPPEAHLSWALDDATKATELARTATDRSEGQYHRGVIMFTLGRRREASRALRAAVAQDPGNSRARYAHATVKQFGTDDPEGLLLRRAGYAVMAAATLVLVLIIIQTIRLAVTEPASKFHWTPMVWYALIAIGTVALAGILPRLAGVKFKEVEISIAPRPAAPEAPTPTLDFGRLPLSTLWGPSTHHTTDVVCDLAGLPEWA